MMIMVMIILLRWDNDDNEDDIFVTMTMIDVRLLIISLIQWVGDSKTKKFTHKSKTYSGAQANHHITILSYQYHIIFI